MKFYRIRSGDKWYIGKYGFGESENSGALFHSRESAEKTLRSETKIADQMKENFPEAHVLWGAALIVEYDLVRIVN
jgi:hypothetical protein